MQYSNVRWSKVDRYPVLRCTIDGKEATISFEQKKALTRYKIVYLGTEFEDKIVIPPAKFQQETELKKLKGFTDDADFYDKVWLPFAKAVQDGTFEEKTFDS